MAILPSMNNCSYPPLRSSSWQTSRNRVVSSYKNNYKAATKLLNSLQSFVEILICSFIFKFSTCYLEDFQPLRTFLTSNQICKWFSSKFSLNKWRKRKNQSFFHFHFNDNVNATNKIVSNLFFHSIKISINQ